MPARDHSEGKGTVTSPPAAVLRAAANANQISAPGLVIELLRDGACRVELPNGHRCIACAEKKASAIAIGDSVRVTFHPYDLSRGRIMS